MQTTSTRSNRTEAAFVLRRSKLDELRKAHGIESDADLARVIGVNAATLYRVSNGLTIPSNTFMAKVAKAFPAISFDQLFCLEDVPASAERGAA